MALTLRPTGVHLSLIQEVSGGVKDFPRERSLVCDIAGAPNRPPAMPSPRCGGYRRSTMDTLIILVALTTLAIPVLAETAAATHIFDTWVRAGSA
jgi:hypothetical protein